MSDPDATPVSPPRRTWRRRFLRLFLLLTGVLVVGRILLALTMPWIVDAVAGSLGCRCEYERFSLSILAGDMEIWHLTLTPEAGGHPLCNLEYACVDVAVTRLLTGSIEVRRLEVDGVDIYLDRAADGTAPVLELARKLLSGTPPTPEPPESGDPADPIDLTAPVSVVAARMQHTHIHLRDRFTTPPVEARLDLNVRISHIGDADQPARFQIMAASPTLLDILRFEGKVSSAGRTVDLSAAFHMAGLHLKPLAPYLGAFGATPVADSMNASANVAVETRPVSSPEGCLRGFFEVRNARADADGRTFAWMKQFRFQVNAFGPAVPDGIADARFHADLGPITLTGIEAEVTRDPSGSWIVACLGLGAVPADPSILPAVFPQQEPTGKAREPERGAPVAETPPPSRPFLQGALSALEVNGATLRFRDASTSPPVAVDLTVPAFSIRDLALGGRAKEPGAIVEGRLEAPGLWKAAVLKGNLGHLPDRLALSFDATVKGVEPEALKPYLEALGAETVMKDGALTCRVDGSAGRSPGGYITGNLDVTDLRFTAAGESMSLARFAVAGLEADLKTNHFHLGRVDVTGGRIRVRREATGMLWIPGMRFGLPGRTHPRPEEAAPSPVPAGPDRTVQGRLGLGHLHVADHQVLFIDEAVTPPTTLSLVDAGLEMRDLTLVFGPEATATPAARVRGAMKLPGLAGSLTVEGEAAGVPDGMRWSLQAQGKDITLQAAAPYLNTMGMRPVLQSGELRAGLSGEVRITRSGLRASASLTDAEVKDRNIVLAAVEAVHLEGAILNADEAQIEGVEVNRPLVRVDRDAAGAIGALGLRLNGAVQPEERPSSDPGSPPPPVHRGSGSSGHPFVIMIGGARVSEARLVWQDRTRSPALETTAEASLDLSRLVLGKPGPDTTLHIGLRVPGAVESMTLTGSVQNRYPRIDARFSLDGRGLQAGPFSALFPPAIRPTPGAGSLGAILEATSSPHAKGGRSFEVKISDALFREGGSSGLQVRLARAGIHVDRFDLAGGVITVDSVEAAGFTLDVQRLSDGTIRVPGLALIPSSPEEKTPEQTPVRTAKKKGKRRGKSPRHTPGNLPLVTVRSLDLCLERLCFQDLTEKGSQPLVVADVRLRTPEVLTLLGEEVGTRPPMPLRLEGTAAPLIRAFRLEMEVAPFASEPGFSVKATADGIRPGGLLEVLPALASLVKDGGLDGGHLAANLEGTLKGRRRHPLDFRLLDDGFGAEVRVDTVTLKDGKGAILAGVDEVLVAVKEINPTTGKVHINSVEVIKPAGSVTRLKDGIHACGLRFPLPEVSGGEAQPAAGPQTLPDASGKSRASPGPEVRLDRFLVSGVDFTFTDRTTSPPLVVPLTDLDMKVVGLTSRMLQDGSQVGFSAWVQAGTVPLPGHGGEESKPLFHGAMANGRLSLHPEPLGRVYGEITGLELTAFKGLAAASGVVVKDGVFDGTARLRFRREGLLDVDTTSTFTDLNITEDIGGPIFTTLHLPAPLGTVLFVLRDHTGAIKIPLSFTLEESRVSPQDIIHAVITNTTSLIVNAVASSPFRIVGGAVDLAGLGGEKETPTRPPEALIFGAGDTVVLRQASDRLDTIAKEMLADSSLTVRLTHVIGSRDMVRAAYRANPPRENCLALLSRLRNRKRHLLEARVKSAARLQTAHDAHLSDRKAAAIKYLGAIDRELGLLERSLDQLCVLLRPGSERHADRRTRAACTAIARDRLEAVKAELVQQVPGASSRITISRIRIPGTAEKEAGEVQITGVRKKTSE